MLLVRPERARRGRDRSVSLGCAGCHELGPGLPGVRSRLVAPPLATLDPDAPGGCLAETPAAPAPRYALSDASARRSRVCYANPWSSAATLPAPRRVLQALARFNCHACHERHGHGGPGASRWIISAAWASSIWAMRAAAAASRRGRKQVAAGMARGGADQRGRGTALHGGAHAAVRAGQRRVAGGGSHRGGRDAGGPGPAPPQLVRAELVGLNGYSCVTCHSFGPHPSLGISVMDMTQMAGRLNWDWFRRYLLGSGLPASGHTDAGVLAQGQASVTSILGVTRSVRSPRSGVTCLWVWTLRRRLGCLKPREGPISRTPGS